MPDDTPTTHGSLRFGLGSGRILPDPDILEIALRCHDLIGAGEARSLHDCADHLNLGKDTLYRRINRFEIAFRQMGHENVRPGDAKFNAVFEKIRFLLECYSSIVAFEQPPLRIRLGASQTLNASLVGDVRKQFSDWCDSERSRNEKFPRKIEIEITAALPQGLRSMGERGELDLLICSCEQNYVEGKYGVVKRIDLPLQLIYPRGHKNFKDMKFLDQAISEELLKEMTVFRVEALEERKPLPNYPDWIVNRARVVRQVPTYPDIHALVKAGGDVAGFSFGELLSSDEQERIETLRLVDGVGENFYELPVCLIRPAKSSLWRTEEESKAIDQLAKFFAGALDRLVKGEIPKDLLDKIWQAEREYQQKSGELGEAGDRVYTRDIYHVRRVPPGRKLSKGEWAWAKGKLGLSINKSGYIKGEHWVPPARPGEGVGRTYRIFGRAMINPAYQKECHLVWQGKADEEVYVASFICRIDDLIHGDLIGSWNGRISLDNTRFRQSTGFFVALRKGKYERGVVDGELLKQLVEDHGREFGDLELKKSGSLEVLD